MATVLVQSECLTAYKGLRVVFRQTFVSQLNQVHVENRSSALTPSPSPKGRSRSVSRGDGEPEKNSKSLSLGEGFRVRVNSGFQARRGLACNLCVAYLGAIYSGF